MVIPNEPAGRSRGEAGHEGAAGMRAYFKRFELKS